MCELNLCLFVCFVVVVVLWKVYKHTCTEHTIKSMQFLDFLMHNVQLLIVPSKNGRFCLEAEMFLKFSESMFNEVSVYSCGQFPLWNVHVLLV